MQNGTEKHVCIRLSLYCLPRRRIFHRRPVPIPWDATKDPVVVCAGNLRMLKWNEIIFVTIVMRRVRNVLIDACECRVMFVPFGL